MLKEYIESLLPKAIYTQEDDGWYIAEIPWYQWFFSQWDDIEEARTNLIDAVEWVILFKLIDWDEKIKNELSAFFYNPSRKEYA